MRVVLVEDHRGDARWFRLMLNESSVPHELAVFETGIQALESFRQTLPPDLIVTDWNLRVLTFDEFMAGVRAIPGYQSTPIAVVTGFAEPVRKEVAASGAICCLEKPVSAEQLREVLRQAGCCVSV